MNPPHTSDFELYDLQRFQADIRRALLMHRTGRLNFFYQMQFPAAQQPFDEGEDILKQLDFRQWLLEPPPESIGTLGAYRHLLANLDKLMDLSREALVQLNAGALDGELYGNLLFAMHEFDRLVDRLISGVITTLTDVDALTGLLNRGAMKTGLDRELARFLDTGEPFTVAMIDADLFKIVNDTFGHGFGDVVLATLADRFLESLRPRDCVYRVGGEEFLVLLPQTPLGRALPVLERLRRRAVGRDISDGEHTVTQSVSIGAAQALVGEDAEAIILRADQALYRAKQADRNRVETDGLAQIV